VVVSSQEPLHEESGGYDMDTTDAWEYGIADLDPQNDQILST